MELIDIIRSKASSIPGVLEESTEKCSWFVNWHGPDYVQSHLLSVDDPESWQRLIDNHAKVSEDGGEQHAVPGLWEFMDMYDVLRIGNPLLITKREEFDHYVLCRLYRDREMKTARVILHMVKPWSKHLETPLLLTMLSVCL